jgi:hypothetical protein
LEVLHEATEVGVGCFDYQAEGIDAQLDFLSFVFVEAITTCKALNGSLDSTGAPRDGVHREVVT